MESGVRGKQPHK